MSPFSCRLPPFHVVQPALPSHLPSTFHGARRLSISPPPLYAVQTPHPCHRCPSSCRLPSLPFSCRPNSPSMSPVSLSMSSFLPPFHVTQTPLPCHSTSPYMSPAPTLLLSMSSAPFQCRPTSPSVMTAPTLLCRSHLPCFHVV